MDNQEFPSFQGQRSLCVAQRGYKIQFCNPSNNWKKEKILTYMIFFWHEECRIYISAHEGEGPYIQLFNLARKKNKNRMRIHLSVFFVNSKYWKKGICFLLFKRKSQIRKGNKNNM